MKRISFHRLGLVLLVSLSLFIGGNFGHALLSANQTSVNASSERNKAHCHSSCYVSSKADAVKPVVRDKDDDPQPQFFELVNPFILASLYTVLISSLFYKFYNRKPPDLFAQTAIWRM